MAVNVSVATDTMSVIPIPVNFDCLGNEMFLYNCSDSGSISCDDASSQTTVVAGAICEDLPGPPSNLTVNSQQSDITLHWEYTDDANNVSNFSVYCKHDKTVNPQLHLNIKTELSLLTKNNSATLIGLLANTVYTCCVSAVFPYMETESTCINVIKGYQEAGSSNSSTLSSIPAATATVASSSSIHWYHHQCSVCYLIIDYQNCHYKKKSSLQSDNVNVTSTVYHQSRGQTQNIGIYSDLSQNQFEPFSNRRDPAVPGANDYESPVDVNIITVNNDPVYSLAETEEETGNYDKLQRN
uniref:Fibronectin type-III domain-containing protein n=1 Tax=Amphimedon queenslandica TaxID=400682 RepID=A0A1X7SPR4_AMPQE